MAHLLGSGMAQRWRFWEEVEDRGHEAFHCHPLTSTRSVQSSSYPLSPKYTTLLPFSFVITEKLHYSILRSFPNLIDFGLLLDHRAVYQSRNWLLGHKVQSVHWGTPATSTQHCIFYNFLSALNCDFFLLFIRYFHQLCQDIVLCLTGPDRSSIKGYYTMSTTFDKLVHLTSSRHVHCAILL